MSSLARPALADDGIADIISASAAGIFADHGALSSPAAEAAAERGEFAEAAWSAIEAAGFPAAMLCEERGGVGPANAMLIARHAGAHALAMPMVETMIANGLLEAVGAAPVTGPVTFCDRTAEAQREGSGWRVSGDLPGVAWARSCGALYAVAMVPEGPRLFRIAFGSLDIRRSANIAGEPRDRCRFDVFVESEASWALPDEVTPSRLRAVGAAFRSAQMAGAIGAILELTVRYASDRKQFGKSIAAFQAVQQMLAVIATQAAVSRAAADIAADALEAPDFDWTAVAVAKIRTGEAAGVVAALAHQVHGAMGFTREYPLQLLVRRLWSWRDEFGGEAEWAAELGRHIAKGGGGRALWPQLTSI